MGRSLGASYRKLFTASAITNLGDGIGTVAYPWLASAVTRNPVLITLIGVAQRLPWLVFTLPAGVITDRVDRRKAMVLMDTARGLVTAVLAVAVAIRSDALPAPDEVQNITGTDAPLYLVVLLATLLLGMAEVLRDNSAQTILPAIVAADDLEAANGRMWSLESIANTFVGPPLGSLLIAVAFALPIVIDAGSFFGAAALVALIPGTFRAARATGDDGVEKEPAHWRADLKEGFVWLWRHPLLKPMAIILGTMNLASMLSGASFVLFVQEVLDGGALVFSVVGMGAAVGAVVAGAFASYISRRFGAGTCLAVTLLGEVVLGVVIGVASWWPLVFVAFGVGSLLGTLWNVITVSLRQAIIPPHLLGRVNSVYRFFAWGMMPIGAFLGGVVVAVVDAGGSRETALRSVWFVNAGIHALLFLLGRRYLTTERIEAARAGG